MNLYRSLSPCSIFKCSLKDFMLFSSYTQILFYKQCSLPEFSPISSGLKTWELKISSFIVIAIKFDTNSAGKWEVF